MYSCKNNKIFEKVIVWLDFAGQSIHLDTKTWNILGKD